MLKRPVLIQLVVGAFFALAAGWLALSWLRSFERPAAVVQQQVPTTSIVVAAADVVPGTVLGPAHLTKVDFPASFVPAGAFGKPEDAQGRVVIVPLARGEVVTELRLAGADIKKGGVAALLADGKRAMAVKADKVQGMAGLINPGDRVDVLVTLEGQDIKPVSKIILENIRVLAAGTEMQTVAGEQKPIPVDVYTLEVTPEQSESLALIVNRGRISLALRNHGDAVTVLTTGITEPVVLQSLTPSVAKSAPVGAPARQGYSIKVMQGTEVTNVTLK